MTPEMPPPSSAVTLATDAVLTQHRVACHETVRVQAAHRKV
jgi:hypothetical protein